MAIYFCRLVLHQIKNNFVNFPLQTFKQGKVKVKILIEVKKRSWRITRILIFRILQEYFYFKAEVDLEKQKETPAL